MPLVFEQFLRFIFRDYYHRKDKHRAFLEQFPCPHCRPDLSYTFYDGIDTSCHVCGRKYSY